MTTNDTVKVVWIDDDPRRREESNNFERKVNDQIKSGYVLKVEFLLKSEWRNFLERKRLQRNSIDLFLIDYILLLEDSGKGAGGSEVAGYIRDYFPESPIYMFSVKEIQEQAKVLVDSALDFIQIQREPMAVYYDALSYREIRESSRRAVRDVFGLLKASEIDYDRIILALPETVKEDIFRKKVQFNTIDFARWTTREFLKLPGFLYNSLYAATKIGMTVEAFSKLSSDFEGAKYSGIFAETNPKLWWNSKLKEIIFKIAHDKRPDDDTTELTILAPRLFELDDSKISRCIVCGEKYPETVGININDDTDYQPVHYRCSESHPLKTRVLYFEEERQFSREK